MVDLSFISPAVIFVTFPMLLLSFTILETNLKFTSCYCYGQLAKNFYINASYPRVTEISWSSDETTSHSNNKIHDAADTAHTDRLTHSKLMQQWKRLSSSVDCRGLTSAHSTHYRSFRG